MLGEALDGDQQQNASGGGIDENLKEAEKLFISNMERFIQRIRMVSQQII
jgi:hypothetical protein